MNQRSKFIDSQQSASIPRPAITFTSDLSSSASYKIFRPMIFIGKILGLLPWDLSSGFVGQTKPSLVDIGLDILHNIQRNGLSSSEEFQIMLLIDKLSRNPIELRAACNFFTINMATFTSILSTILAYLVVLMQFREPSNSLSNQTGKANKTRNSGTKRPKQS